MVSHFYLKTRKYSVTKDRTLGIPRKFYAFSPNSESSVSAGNWAAPVLTLCQAAFTKTSIAISTTSSQSPFK